MLHSSSKDIVFARTEHCANLASDFALQFVAVSFKAQLKPLFVNFARKGQAQLVKIAL